MYDDLISLADGTEHAVLRRPGSDFAAGIPKALLRPFRRRRDARVEESVVPTRSAHWYWAIGDDSPEPFEGDEIEDARGIRWTILETHRSELNETWQCVARSYSVRFGLDEYVDHLRTAYEKSPAGTLRPGFHVVRTGIAAKFSAPEISMEDGGGEIVFALIREPLAPEPGDAFRKADGSLLDILKVRPPLYRAGWTEIRLKQSR